MSTFSIKQIGKEDIQALQAISIRTFKETFDDSNSPENMAAYIAESLSTETLLREMDHEGAAFYFAYADKKLIGYLKINLGSAQTEIKGHDALEIERIYVLKDYQGLKAGQFLFNKALEVARNINAKYVWLGVWEKNHKAIQFYTKNGFYTFDQHIFKLGDDEQTDIMMRLDLS